ncbi:hypothetical protein Patl1_35258 [Pistacia atlantica]|nr:hypothetical protein Patl1_35258 [Pistacia atlantica]
MPTPVLGHQSPYSLRFRPNQITLY